MGQKTTKKWLNRAKPNQTKSKQTKIVWLYQNSNIENINTSKNYPHTWKQLEIQTSHRNIQDTLLNVLLFLFGFASIFFFFQFGEKKKKNSSKIATDAITGPRLS